MVGIKNRDASCTTHLVRSVCQRSDLSLRRVRLLHPTTTNHASLAPSCMLTLERSAIKTENEQCTSFKATFENATHLAHGRR